MKLLEKILMPVEIDTVSDEQLETAVKLSEKFNSDVLLLYVLPEEAKLSSVKSYVDQYVETEMDKITEKMSLPKDKIIRLIRYGNTFEQIISVSESENVNLILRANQPSETDKPITVDVLSEKLVRKSQKPVWIVKNGMSVIPKNILCPVDFSDSSARALNNAVKIARSFKADLFIVNVHVPLQENFSRRLNIDFDKENRELEEENKQKLEKFLDEFNFTDIHYSVDLLQGKPENEIINFVRNRSIDLTFMGATGKTYLQRLMLGSVTENVLRELPSAMIVTKSENLLELKIDADISNLEMHYNKAKKLEEVGYYQEAVDQLKICLQINDLHLPALSRLSKLYTKTGQKELAGSYEEKAYEVLRRLWDKKIELEIRKGLKLY